MARIVRVQAAVTLAAILILSLALASTALAHEHREVGDYEFVVGWQDEPAFVGETNGLDLRITNRETEQPVEGLESTLQAEVIFGGQQRALELRPVFREPGHYTADLVPTEEGDYRFHIFGAIDGTQVDETFDSADGQFNGVKSNQAIQFPETIPAVGELAQVARAAEQQATTAVNMAGTAQTLAVAGIIVGALGVLLGGLAFMTSGRRTQATEPLTPGERRSEEARS